MTNATQKRTPPPKVSVYLSNEVKTQLMALAQRERRSMSEMAVILIEDGLVRFDPARPVTQN
jgi:hypothetical protein